MEGKSLIAVLELDSSSCGIVVLRLGDQARLRELASAQSPREESNLLMLNPSALCFLEAGLRPQAKVLKEGRWPIDQKTGKLEVRITAFEVSRESKMCSSLELNLIRRNGFWFVIRKPFTVRDFCNFQRQKVDLCR